MARPTKATDCAFPSVEGAAYGLTKREYFAAAALQGMLANETMADDAATPSGAGMAAVNIADALIAALNLNKQETNEYHP